MSPMARDQKWAFTFDTSGPARPGTEGPFYELTGGVLFPERVELLASPEQPQRHPHAQLRLEIVKGRPVCTALTFYRSPGGKPIEASTVREIDVAALIGAAIVWQSQGARAIVEYVHGGEGWSETSSGGRVFRDLHNTEEQARKLRRQWADTDDKLRQVAEAYLSDPKAPTVAVMRHFNLDPEERRKAARWVAQAKEAGLITEED